MPAPRELPQEIPAPPPPGKSFDAKAPGWVMGEIDICIMYDSMQC